MTRKQPHPQQKNTKRAHARTHARRTENDERLKELGDSVVTDRMVTAWRPQLGERLGAKVREAEAALAAPPGGNATAVLRGLRTRYNHKLYGSDIDGYEEYRLAAMMLADAQIGLAHKAAMHNESGGAATASSGGGGGKRGGEAAASIGARARRLRGDVVELMRLYRNGGWPREVDLEGAMSKQEPRT